MAERHEEGAGSHPKLSGYTRAIQLLIDPATGTIVDASPAACDFYGYAPHELVGKPIIEINTLPREACFAAMSEAVSLARNVFDFRHRLASGALREVEVHAGPVQVGERTLLHAIVHDVTERKRADEALKLQVTAFATAMDGMAVLGADQRYLFLNEAHSRAYGFEHPEEMVGVCWRELYEPEEAERIGVQAMGALRASGRWRGEAVGRRRDGSHFDQELSLSALPDGGLVCVVRDVTLRKRADEALKLQVTAFAAAMDGMAVLGADERYMFLNEAHARAYGFERPEQMVGLSWRELYEPDEVRRIEVQAMGTLRATGRWRGEAVGRRRDGSHFDQELSLSGLADGGLVCVVRDVTERKRAERVQSALYRISALTHSVADVDELYAGVHAVVGELMYARNFYIALYDRDADRLTFPYFVDEVDPPPPTQAPGGSLTGHVLRTGEPLLADPATFARMLREGHASQIGSNSVDWLGVPLRRSGETFGVLVVQSYRDDVRFTPADRDLLTYVAQHVGAAIDRKRASDALRESETRFRTLARTAPCAIFIHQDEKFVYANDACLEISGRTREEFLALRFWELPAPDFRDVVRARGLAYESGEEPPGRYEFRVLRPDGEERWLDFSGGVIGHDGRPAMLGVAFDITQRKHAEEQIRQLAYHDPLTGLPNRLLCHDRLSVAVAQAHRHGQRLALLFLDLDRFKTVNDSLGHALGDELLKGVAERLTSVVREGDTVARLGGDEFVLLLPGIPRAVDAVRVGEKVLDALRKPFDLQGHEVRATASLGISLYPNDGVDAETLIKNADTAMYRAKQQGRDDYQLYAPAMNAAALERLALEHDLRQAHARGELELHYQPVLELASGRVVEVETLLRWRRPRGFVAPAEFVPLAEMTGLLVTLGPWILGQACAQAREWDRLAPGLGVTVNLSARQLQQPELPDDVGAALRSSGLEPRALHFDVTEAALERNPEAALETLRKLKALGVGLTLDDFGAGPTSLRDLRRLPLDGVKLDPALVRGAPTDNDQAAQAGAVIQLAHALRLYVVAEGVESEEQLGFLAAQGCDRMQGYLFSGALPASELAELLAKRPRGVRPTRPAPRRRRP